MSHRASLPETSQSPAMADDGLVMASENCDNECLTPSLPSASIGSEALTTLCSSSGLSWFTWRPDRGEFVINGRFSCNSLSDWLDRIHKDDRKCLSKFWEEGWRNTKETASLEFRLMEADGSPLSPVYLRQTSTASGDDRSPFVCGFIEEISSLWKDEVDKWKSFINEWQERSDITRLSEFRDITGAIALALLERKENSPPELISLSIAAGHNRTELENTVRETVDRISPESGSGVSTRIATQWGSCFIRTLPAGDSGISFAVVSVYGPARTEISPETDLVSALLLEAARRNSDLNSRKTAEKFLRQSQNLASIGRLATGVAHDFNNLLTIIQGHTSFLESAARKIGDPEMLDSISVIEAATDQAVDLSRQLLVRGKCQDLHFENYNLNEIIQNSSRLIRRMLEESISLHLDLTEDPGPVRADSSMINQILMNLVANARDAMPGSGEIVIKTQRITGDLSGISEPSSEYLLLSVSDNGPGMPPGVVKKIFDPFFTTKAEGKGTGIGLANVASIVEQHGGTIDVQSIPGRGTTFSLYFPITSEVKMTPYTEKPSQADIPQKEKNDSSSTSLSKQPEGDEFNISGSKVLLVEDEDSVRKLVKRLLEINGCTVVEAPTGRKALDLWPEIKNEISVVVSDIIMPDGVSGWDLAKELHEKSPELGILLTSGYDERPEDHGLGEDSRVAFLQKPYEAQKLRSNIYELLRHSA